MKNPTNLNLIRDALYNLHARSGSSIDHGKGCMIGVVSVLMSYDYTFKQAFKSVVSLLPEGYRIECIPECWRKDLPK